MHKWYYNINILVLTWGETNTLDFSSNVIGSGLYWAMIGLFYLYKHLHRNSTGYKEMYLCFWPRQTVVHFPLACFIPTATVWIYDGISKLHHKYVQWIVFIVFQ